MNDFRFVRQIILHIAGSAACFLLGMHLSGFLQGACMAACLLTALHLLKVIAGRPKAPKASSPEKPRPGMAKRDFRQTKTKECALCGKPPESLQWRIGENLYCRKCYDLVRGRMEQERLERGISVSFEAPLFMRNVRDTYRRESFPETGNRFFEGALRLDCGTAGSGLLDAWDHLCLRKETTETWAVFCRDRGVILRRTGSEPYTIVSSFAFDPEETLNEPAQQWSACLLPNPSGVIPGTQSGEWSFGEREPFDETYRLTCREHWLTVSAGWHYSDYGTGNRLGHCYSGFQALIPAGLFTGRDTALDFLARCPGSYAWPYASARTRMEEEGFLRRTA